MRVLAVACNCPIDDMLSSITDHTIIIIIHLLGLAPAGYLAAPDNGPEGRLRGGACQVPS
jgi:hypothetical protein